MAFIHFEKKITDLGISYFDTACRAVDLCVAIWFPLVLWKSAKPDELWLLNPKVLLQKSSAGSAPDIITIYSSLNNQVHPVDSNPESSAEQESLASPSCSGTETVQECFICYDSERDDAGPLIKPCKCKVSCLQTNSRLNHIH